MTNPEHFETESLNLQVDTTDGELRGKTYVVENETPNVQVITKVNREKVIDEIAESFKVFNA
ncbi:MAG: nucleoside hydrolase [Clostridiaceae bacterium]|nr:nucleoside hydrolase [Clostridiaceae bacterium]